MDRMAMSEMTTYRWSFEEDVQYYLDAGICGIGVWRQKLADFGEEKGAELLRESGLKVSSLLWAGGFTGSEGRTHRESINDAREAIRLAALLEAGCLILYTGSRGGHTQNHSRRLVRKAIEQLSPLASELKVELALEPMHAGCAGEWTFLTDLDATLKLIHAVDCPQLKLVFDSYHLMQVESVLNRLEEIVPHIAVVQLGDAQQPPCGEQNRCCLGKGVLPLRELVRGLVEVGYQGFFEVELLGEDMEFSNYEELLSESKHALEGLLVE